MSTSFDHYESYTIKLFSNILGYINSGCLIALLIGLLYKLQCHVYDRMKQNNISSKPGLLTLIYVGVSHILIFITTYWWYFKIFLLFIESESNLSHHLNILFISWTVFASVTFLKCEPCKTCCCFHVRGDSSCRPDYCIAV